MIKPKTIHIGIQWFAIIILGVFLGLFTLFTLKLPSRWMPLFLLAGVFPFVVLVIGNLRKILLALILLDIPIQLDIALGSSWILNYTGAINGYIISVTTICLAALYVIWMLEVLVIKKTVSHPFRRPNLYLTLYLAVTSVSLIFAELQKLASFEIFLLIQIFLLYFYVINNISSHDDLIFIVNMLLIGLIVESLIIVLMQFIGQGFSIAGIMGNIYANSTSPEGVSRIGGTLVSANVAGSYLSLLLVPALSIIFTRFKKPFRWLGIVGFFCGAIALILTGSRGAWLAASISFSIFSFFAFRKGWLDFKIMIVGCVIGIFAIILFYTPIYERIWGYDFGAAESRLPQFQIAFQMIKDHPILGIGANNYPFIQQRYLFLDPNNSVFRWAVHNKYLLVWAETGIFGILFFIIFLITTILQGFKVVQNNDLLLSPLALGFSAAIIGQMLHMFFDVFHGRPQVQLLWLIAALIMVMSASNELKTNDRSL